MKTSQIREASELALAAYGQFKLSTGPESPLIENLTNLNGDEYAFAEQQAQQFARRFIVGESTYNDSTSTDPTSFDATVFLGSDSSTNSGNLNQVYIALRGTQQKSGSPNDISTGASMLLGGAAFDQIVAMYN